MTFQKVTKMTEITSYHYLLHSVYTEHVHQILTSTFKPVVKWLQREQKNIQDWSAQHWTRNPRIQV